MLLLRWRKPTRRVGDEGDEVEFLPSPQSPVPSPQSPIPSPQSPIPSPQSPVPSPYSQFKKLI
ncbi:hypothetical protein [Nostoc sp. PCC 7524]|uniref:hypothetical protein n=1 Tax=Nostoc sp. (strain ATCC 29411 / PCC 7524) TaxID=28072 RepID=UPI001C0A89F9|nr:hypothetical protein [Nostoc sp. PCC 7524]